MNVGGTARYVGELVSSAPDNGYEALLATGHVQGAEVEDGVVSSLSVIRVPHLGRAIAPLNDLRAFLELRQIISNVKPDVVHTHTFKAGLLARLVGGEFKRIHTFHGHLFEDQSFSSLKKFVITFLEQFLAKRTDVLVSVGEQVGFEIRNRGIGIEEKWESISPGVVPLKLVAKSVARQSLGLTEAGVIVGWMARMTSVKNPMLALEVARQFPNVLFVMAGGGELLDAVRSAAPENVKVIGWADASIMWSAVDAVLSTSDNEGMPVALIEAQFAGLPVVATDVGSNREVIEDGESGFVVRGDVKVLVLALSKLLASSEVRATFGASGKERCEREFSIAKMNQAHEEMYIRCQFSVFKL
jgi:glycosyltransferase involved in cell wall biosynthesis